MADSIRTTGVSNTNRSHSQGCSVVLLAVFTASMALSCDRSDERYVCGLENAEDLVRLGATPWVVASHLSMRVVFENDKPTSLEYGPGPLTAVNVDTRVARRLYPDGPALIDWDGKMYPDCPKPPTT